MMTVHAHPDDESSKGAATVAYYRSLGREVMIVSCTGGEAGDILNPNLERQAMAERDLPGLRRLEMAAAQQALGAQHRWLGYVDSGMAREDGSLPENSFASIPLEISRQPLVKLIREFKPQVLVTYDENGGYPHPDHIRTHQISVAAIEAAADPTLYPELGEPWKVTKLYYDRIFNYPRMKANVDELHRSDPESPLLEELQGTLEWMKDRPDTSTTHVPAGDFFEVRDQALRSHACQVSPDSNFFFWSNDLQRAAWPYEDFELVWSDVDTLDSETDLFTGIEDTE